MTQLSDSQGQTSNIFGYESSRRATYDTGESMTADTRRWYLEKYFGGDEAQIYTLFGVGDKVFLDAGCGSGCSTATSSSISIGPIWTCRRLTTSTWTGTCR